MLLTTNAQKKIRQICQQDFYIPFIFDYVDSVNSTNTALLQLAKQGNVSARVLFADQQTAGRGQLGKVWQSTLPQQQTITLSVGIPVQLNNLDGLSLAVGVGLAQALNPQITLKWPNDLFFKKSKLGGILIESCGFRQVKDHFNFSCYLVIGVGINLSINKCSLKKFGLNATSLSDVDNKFNAQQVTTLVIRSIINAYANYVKNGWLFFREEYAKRDYLFGKQVRLSSGRIGTASGVGANGELLVSTSLGIEKIISTQSVIII